MSTTLALVMSAAALVTTVVQGGWLLYPLLLSLAIFGVLHWHRGTAPYPLIQIIVQGARQGVGVLSILLLIGLLMAAWMAAGTVATLVYYGLQLIQPQLFVLVSFVLTAAISVLMGTSFGAVGTIGLALMVMARGTNMPEPLVAGAIIAGAYVGDRCSPMSSSANLVAVITESRLHSNLKGMVLTSRWALTLTVGFYAVASWRYPLQTARGFLLPQISEAFVVSPVGILPAIAIPLLIILRVPVRRTMLVSLGIALVLGMELQAYSPLELARFLVAGFTLERPAALVTIFQGGGLVAMGRVCLVVVASTALAELLAETHIFRPLQGWANGLEPQRPLMMGTTAISLLMAAYGCTQTITILLTHQLVRRRYAQTQQSQMPLALALENSAVVIAPLIPWNIAGLVPANLLSVGFGFIPFAPYLYLVPIMAILTGSPGFQKKI